MMRSSEAMQTASPDQHALLEVRDLKVHFPIYSGLLRRKTDSFKAVDGVSFNVPAGKTVGLVGESGSGKTTIGRTLVKLISPTSGKAFWKGKEILSMSEKEFRPLRRKIQYIFQDPFGSLNPRMTVGKIIGEALEIHFADLDRTQRTDRVESLLQRVGLKGDMMHRHPHEFSGGQRQRIGIARALAVEPEFLICDEPVSALDVSVQAQIVNLLQDLQEELGLALLFIAHDLAVVEHISDFVLVLHRGKIVESGPARDVLEHPIDPYTRDLLAAVPRLEEPLLS
jgi:peptide/nickel transport system ATP-binding protein/oligopeptide transport system ATP-binding protein